MRAGLVSSTSGSGSSGLCGALAKPSQGQSCVATQGGDSHVAWAFVPKRRGRRGLSSQLLPPLASWYTLEASPYLRLRLRSQFGWHYLSNATCLMRPRSLYVFVYRVEDHHNLPNYLSWLKKTSVTQVVLDKWLLLNTDIIT